MHRGFIVSVLAAAAATSAQGDVGVVDTAQAQLQFTPIVISRLGPPTPAQRYQGRSNFHINQSLPIRSAVGGVDASPFVTALPGEMWHGRLHSFGAADGVGFSGIAVRAKSFGFSSFQSASHVSGFLASELRYGIKVNEDDLLTVDLSTASQRMPAMQATGYRQSIHVSSLYLGAAVIHARRISMAGGWYHLSLSGLSSFDYAIERAAGMPPAGQGVRLGLDWRLGQNGAPAPARIGLECRDGDADRDRLLGLGSGWAAGRERRMLLRFTEPF